MALDLEEQEQLDQLKALWAKYGNLVSWVLIICLAGYAGWTYWNNTQSNRTTQASGLYASMQKAIEAKDNAKAQAAAADIRKDYSNTVYAQFSALAAAKVALDANDAKTAKAQLQWVIDAKFNDEFPAIARLRLSGILLDEKAYDEALKLVSVDVPEKFQPLVFDRKGDILTAQNKLVEARAMYQSALDKTEDKTPAHQLIEIKLESVGGGPTKSVAEPAKGAA